jgi:hypothetical protein
MMERGVLTRWPVTEDLVSYMEGAMYYTNESFLIEDPQFAVDFAPNGKTFQVIERWPLTSWKGLSSD